MMNRTKSASPLLALFFASAAFTQGPSPYRLLVDKGAYLQALEVQEAKMKAAAPGDERSRAMQTLAGFYGFVGDYQSARQLMQQNQRAQGANASATLLKYPEGPVQTPRAIDEIVRVARGQQVVILNEAHDMSRHRAFATELALALRKEGFTYFAAETFSPDIAATQKQGYPNRRTGYYTLDPVFGDLVRQAVRVGYKLVAYENEDEARPPDFIDAINARETAQSRNLTERIFQKDPKARVFIYVGLSHAAENERKQSDGRILAWMAARLKKQTGIDPLTIEQSEVFEPGEGKAAVEAPNPVEKFPITRPAVVKLAEGKYWLTPTATGSMDMQVFQPFTQEKQGRPDWLAMNGYRKPFPVKAVWMPTSGRILLQAFVEGEGDDAIPMDQILLTAGKPVPVLLLPKGKYRIVVQDGMGVSRHLESITQK